MIHDLFDLARWFSILYGIKKVTFGYIFGGSKIRYEESSLFFFETQNVVKWRIILIWSFAVLERKQIYRFSGLTYMEIDMLSVPKTIMASESSFSIWYCAIRK